MIVILGITLFTGTALAYSTSNSDKECKKPKFRTFEPEHLSEVDPGSKISFHVSNWTDPTTIKAEARKIPLQINVVNKMNFFVVTANLPDSINGKYARIHLVAKSKEGGCRGQDGWLLKVRNAAVIESSVPAVVGNEEDVIEQVDN